MSERKSHWILGFLYINRDDTRVLVPLPCKLGLALNFGNPRALGVLYWIWIGFLLAMVTAPIIAHPSYFARDPAPLFWVVLANVAALAIIRLNGCFAWLDYRFILLASFGMIATSLGFSLQALINGPLVALWGADHLTWVSHLILAPVAAVAQTLGKGAAILMLVRVRPTSSRLGYVRYGLLVGLGFTILEITVLYFRVAWAQAPLTSLSLSVWERTSASMFHVYSGGLVALACWSRRYLPIVLVLVIHATMDFLAGIAGSLPLSLCGLETVFSVLAAGMWVAFLLTAWGITSNDSPA